jgi:large subunit ribosomal protein L5
MNEKCGKRTVQKPSLILSGSFQNFKSKNTILQNLYALQLMAGLRPKLTKSKESIAAFQLKKNTLLGFKLNLRNSYFFGFMERLALTVLPRAKDFQGLSSTVKCNEDSYMVGFPNLNIFLEMDYQYHIFKSDFGMNLQFFQKRTSSTQLLVSISHLQIPFYHEKP